jgi:alpha-amylase
MTRRKEAYHNKLLASIKQTPANNHSGVASIHDLVISKEPGLEKKLHYDWYRRSSLIDHFWSADTELEQVLKCENEEAGDFVQSPYICETELTSDCLIIRLFRDGFVQSHGKKCKIFLSKTIRVFPKNSIIEIKYQIKNLESLPVDLWFAPEFNVALLAGQAPDRYYYFDHGELPPAERNLASMGIVESVGQMGLKDEWQKIDVQFHFSNQATVWRFPIETISQSEGGFEKVYQSSVIIPNWKIKLNESDEWTVQIKQLIVDL